MSILDSAKAIRALSQTPRVLNAVLYPITDKAARTLRDNGGGDDSYGWTIIEVIGHMADYMGIFLERAQAIAEHNHPTLTVYDHEARVESEQYRARDLNEAMLWHKTNTDAFVAYLQTLPPDAWTRSGFHPEAGELTITELAINAALHDLNHIDQIAKAAGV
jgi:hypothetical protein